MRFPETPEIFDVRLSIDRIRDLVPRVLTEPAHCV